MKRKLLSLFLLLTPLLSFAYDFTSGGLFYKITSTISNTVEVMPGSSLGGAVTIPNKVTYNAQDYIVTSIADSAFYTSNITSLILPESIISIGDRAFYVCMSLSSVNFPEGLISIGDEAFSSCIDLTSLTLPESLSYIGDKAFEGCEGLTSFTVKEANESFCSEGNVLFNKSKTKLIFCIENKSGDYVIPSTVTTIEHNAFSCCSELSSVSIPSSVSEISECTFLLCSGLTSVSIPSSVTTIGEYAFQSCTSLTSIIIPESVISIENFAFLWCSGLETVSIASSVSSIGDYAFSSCTGLKDVYNYSQTPQEILQYYKFDGVDKANCTLHVPIGTKALYEVANEWKDFDIVEGLTAGVSAAKNEDWVFKPTAKGVSVSGLSSDSKVSVYSINGTLIQTIEPSNGELEVNLPAKGVYILNFKNQSVKFIY